MSNWAQEAFAPIESIYKEQVMADTWGHLAPVKNTSYRGKVMFMKPTCDNGNIQLIDYDFINLDGGPWLYDALYDALNDLEGIEEGSVYEWATTFRNYRFYGKPKQILKFKPLN